MHLLTREAFSVYQSHLRGPASVIAVHISNQTLDLRPVLAGIGREFGFHAVRVDVLRRRPFLSVRLDFVLARSRFPLRQGDGLSTAEPFPAETQPISWTDDYCDLLKVMRWHD